MAFSCSGEKGTLTHGALVEGKFDGFIQSYQGTYYVEPAERYLEGKNVPFHSVIYHEDDIGEFYQTNTSTMPIFYFPSLLIFGVVDTCICKSGKCEVRATDPMEPGECDGPLGKSSFPRCSLAE